MLCVGMSADMHCMSATIKKMVNDTDEQEVQEAEQGGASREPALIDEEAPVVAEELRDQPSSSKKLNNEGDGISTRGTTAKRRQTKSPKLTIRSPSNFSLSLNQMIGRFVPKSNSATHSSSLSSRLGTPDSQTNSESTFRSKMAVRHKLSRMFFRGGTVSSNANTLRRDLTSLDVTIQDDLLRAVCLGCILEGLGREFARNEGTDALYERSERVESINDFISHDWQTGRWPKVLTLWLRYNSLPAYVACVLSATLAFVLQLESINVLPKLRLMHGFQSHRESDVLPGNWSSVLGCAAFILTLMFWQNVLKFFNRPLKKVFVDKFCICQTNEKRKTEGILCLGGFLERSERLVVLWSPRYFTRLWCAYEMATWMHLDDGSGNRMNKLQVSPVALSMILMLYWITMLVSYISYFINATSIWYSIIYFVAGLLPVHATRHYARELRGMPEQLASFNIRESQCFCCTVGHTLTQPDGTVKRLRCDRKLVEKTLRKWFRTQPLQELPMERALQNTLLYQQPPLSGGSLQHSRTVSSSPQRRKDTPPALTPTLPPLDNTGWVSSFTSASLSTPKSGTIQPPRMLQQASLGEVPEAGQAGGEVVEGVSTVTDSGQDVDHMSDDEDTSHLENFDNAMREKLTPIILKVMSGFTGMSYRSALLCTTPVLAASLDEIVAYENVHAKGLLLQVAARIVYVFCLAPSAAKLVLTFSLRCDCFTGVPESKMADLSMTAMISFMFSCFFCSGYAVSQWAITHTDTMGAFVIVIVAVVLTLVVFNDRVASFLR